MDSADAYQREPKIVEVQPVPRRGELRDAHELVVTREHELCGDRLQSTRQHIGWESKRGCSPEIEAEVVPRTARLPCASTAAAVAGWHSVYVFGHCGLPVTGRSGAETERHDTAPSAWAGGEGGKQARSLVRTHDVLQEW